MPLIVRLWVRVTLGLLEELLDCVGEIVTVPSCDLVTEGVGTCELVDEGVGAEEGVFEGEPVPERDCESDCEGDCDGVEVCEVVMLGVLLLLPLCEPDCERDFVTVREGVRVCVPVLVRVID